MLNILSKRSYANSETEVGELFAAGVSQEVRRAAAYLEDRLKKAAHGEPFSEAVLLTPALAEMLLRRNAENRAVRPLRLADYVSDMKSGSWKLNGESIKVSKDGFLNDGQHRCQAVVASGCTIKTMILFGVSRESRTTLDQGAVRSPGDYLGMQGVPYANEVAAASSLLWQYETRQRVSYQSAHRPTKQQIQDTYGRHKSIGDSIAFIPRKGSANTGGASVLAFVHYVLAHVSREAADYFIAKLVRGDGLNSRDPIYVCRERLHGDKRMKVDEKVELIFRAWNAHRKGRKLGKLQVMGGDLPQIEG
jgi:hypothetical protein